MAEMVRLLGFETVNVCTLTDSKVTEKIAASVLRLRYIIENFTPKITSYLNGHNYFKHENGGRLLTAKNLESVNPIRQRAKF